MMETFATYLTKYAIQQGNMKSKKLLLGGSSAYGYYSCFRNMLIDSFKTEDIPYLKSNHHKTLLRKIVAVKTDYCRKHKKQFSQKTEPATEKEIEAFKTSCFWDGSLDCAEYVHLLTQMITNCGRGSEVSFIIWILVWIIVSNKLFLQINYFYITHIFHSFFQDCSTNMEGHEDRHNG